MKPNICLILFLTTISGLGAGKRVAAYDWREVPGTVQSGAGILVEVDGRRALKIQNTNATPLRVELLRLENPPVRGTIYGFEGQVKCEGVQGDGFLEMWSQFPSLKPELPPGRYFSRTLANSGGMAKLTGDSGWRPCSLPFDRTGTSNAPSRLELAVYLPGPGTVYLGPLELVEHTSLLQALGPSHAWWSNRAAGLFGGLGGALLGCLGALMGWLAARGRARNFVLGAGVTLIFLGVLCLGFGVAALVLKQPFQVYYPLLLGGILTLGIFTFRLKHFYTHYQALELRRMQSLDALGG